MKKVLQFIILLFVSFLFLEKVDANKKVICDYSIKDPYNTSEPVIDARIVFTYDETNKTNFNLEKYYKFPGDKSYTAYSNNQTIDYSDIAAFRMDMEDKFKNNYINAFISTNACPSICSYKPNDEYLIIGGDSDIGTCIESYNTSINQAKSSPKICDNDYNESTCKSKNGKYENNCCKIQDPGTPPVDTKSCEETPYSMCSVLLGNDDNMGYSFRKIKLIFNYKKCENQEDYKLSWYQGSANSSDWTFIAHDNSKVGTNFDNKTYNGVKLRVEESTKNYVYKELQQNITKYPVANTESKANKCEIDLTKVYFCSTNTSEQGVTIFTITSDKSKLERECTGMSGTIGDASDIIHDDPDSHNPANIDIPKIPEGNLSTCDEIMGKDLASIVKVSITILQIIAAIITIVKGMMTLMPPIIAKDAEALKKSASTLVKMAIILIIIFLFKPLLKFIGNLLDFDTSCIL